MLPTNNNTVSLAASSSSRGQQRSHFRRGHQARYRKWVHHQTNPRSASAAAGTAAAAAAAAAAATSSMSYSSSGWRQRIRFRRRQHHQQTNPRSAAAVAAAATDSSTPDSLVALLQRCTLSDSSSSASSSSLSSTAASATTITVKTLLQSKEPRPISTVGWKTDWLADPRATYRALSEASTPLLGDIMELITEYVRVDLEEDRDNNVFGARAWKRLFGDVPSFQPHFPVTFENDFQTRHGKAFLFYRPTHVNDEPLTASSMSELSSSPLTPTYPPLDYTASDYPWDLYKDRVSQKPCYVYIPFEVMGTGESIAAQAQCIPSGYTLATFLNTLVLNFARYAWTGERTHSKGFVRVETLEEGELTRWADSPLCIGCFSSADGLAIRDYQSDRDFSWKWVGVAAQREFDGQVVS